MAVKQRVPDFRQAETSASAGCLSIPRESASGPTEAKAASRANSVTSYSAPMKNAPAAHRRLSQPEACPYGSRSGLSVPDVNAKKKAPGWTRYPGAESDAGVASVGPWPRSSMVRQSEAEVQFHSYQQGTGTSLDYALWLFFRSRSSARITASARSRMDRRRRRLSLRSLR